MLSKLLLSCFLIFILSRTIAQNDYSFLVAGHAYGAHAGSNVGLHPPFLEHLKTFKDSAPLGVFFTGDIVNRSNEESWNSVADEMNDLNISSYYSMGNHDENALGYQVFNEKHAGTYYSFIHKNGLFVILNSTIGDRQINHEQQEFLQNCIDNAGPQVDHLFVFFHEVLWNSHERYRDVLSNSRSRYDQMKSHSNFWPVIYNMLNGFGKSVFVFTGDVGGNTDAISLFYDKQDNVTLISSGMGEVADENYLHVTVKGESVVVDPVPLRDSVSLQKIEQYALPMMPDTIYGQSIVIAGSVHNEYFIEEPLNATNIVWHLSSEMIGESNGSNIFIDFTNDFTNGEIGVQTVRHGYGKSEIKTMAISVDNSNFYENFKHERKSTYLLDGNKLNLIVKGYIPGYYQFQLIGMNGNRISLGRRYLSDNEVVLCFDVANVATGSYLLYFKGLSDQGMSKLMLY